jgi:hypothetical protein
MDLVISSPDEISPEWLSRTLGKHYAQTDVTVESVDVILTKKLACSTGARIAIRYSSDRPPNLPDSLFLKLTDLKEASAEVDFYTKLAPFMSCPPLVRCFDAKHSVEDGRSHILLADLSTTHSQPPDPTAPSAQLSRLAVEALAKVHAFWWEHPNVGSGIGKVFDRSWLTDFVNKLNEDVEIFIDAAGDLLRPDQREAYDLMLGAAEKIWGRLTDARALTATHGDAHWWNFLYPIDPQTHSVHVFDWHLWHIDLGARDLAFLLALGGFAEPRPELESDLIRAYHEALVANGVGNYSWEDLWEDYRWSAIRNLNIPVIYRKQGKHPTTWQTALRRASQSFAALECRALIT